MKGIKARRVYFQIDKILDYTDNILPIDKLKEISSTMKWSSQSSGITIPDDVAAGLEKEWAKYKTSKVKTWLLPPFERPREHITIIDDEDGHVIWDSEKND